MSCGRAMISGIPALHPRSCGKRLQTLELDHAELPGPYATRSTRISTALRQAGAQCMSVRAE